MKTKAKYKPVPVSQLSLPDYLRWLATTLEQPTRSNLQQRADAAAAVIDASSHVLSECDEYDLLPDAREPLRLALARTSPNQGAEK